MNHLIIVKTKPGFGFTQPRDSLEQFFLKTVTAQIKKIIS
jgi:hypothetical protein